MNATERLTGAFFRRQPAAAARLLESMTMPDAQAVIAAVPAPDAAAVLQRMLPTVAAGCIAALPVPLVIDVFLHLPSQSAAALLRHLNERSRREILSQLGGSRSAALRLLLHYPRTAVGAWMEPNALILPHDSSVRDARARIEAADRSGARIYVLDRERKVRGATDGVTLLRSGNAGRVAAIAEPVPTLWAREPLAVASEREAWEHETEIPVVNRQDEFVGVIAYRDIGRGLKELANPEIVWASDGEMHEIFDVFLCGLQGAWQGLSEVFDAERSTRTGEQS